MLIAHRLLVNRYPLQFCFARGTVFFRRCKTVYGGRIYYVLALGFVSFIYFPGGLGGKAEGPKCSTT